MKQLAFLVIIIAYIDQLAPDMPIERVAWHNSREYRADLPHAKFVARKVCLALGVETFGNDLRAAEAYLMDLCAQCEVYYQDDIGVKVHHRSYSEHAFVDDENVPGKGPSVKKTGEPIDVDDLSASDPE